MSFRRKPESSAFKVLRTYWTPVFTGVTAENKFFTPSGGAGGISEGFFQRVRAIFFKKLKCYHLILSSFSTLVCPIPSAIISTLNRQKNQLPSGAYPPPFHGGIFPEGTKEQSVLTQKSTFRKGGLGAGSEPV